MNVYLCTLNFQLQKRGIPLKYDSPVIVASSHAIVKHEEAQEHSPNALPIKELVLHLLKQLCTVLDERSKSRPGEGIGSHALVLKRVVDYTDRADSPLLPF